MSRLRLITVFSLCALLALPAVASARPGKRNFHSTYPHASALCAAVNNGHVPKRLAASADKVKEACATLRASYDAARKAYADGIAPIRKQADDAIAALRATCKQARIDGNPAACKAARVSTRAMLADLGVKARDLGKAYRTSVNAARKTFWSTIRALRGGSSVAPDTTSATAPAPGLPSDSAVTSA